MTTHHPQLTAHKGLRGEILHLLKRAQPLTAKDLARQLSVSANAIRHHLKELEAEALIVYGREQRGVGAPTFAYRLSADGEALFPRAYEETLTQLLERVAGKSGRQAAVELFEDHYRELTRQLQAELAGAAASERVDLIARLMNQQGYMAEWHEAAGAFRLSEHVPQKLLLRRAHLGEAQFLRDVLGAAVERRTHITSGCNACEYAITFAEPATPAREPGVTEQP